MARLIDHGHAEAQAHAHADGIRHPTYGVEVGVVGRATATRWSAVTGGVVLLCLTPAVLGRLPGGGQHADPAVVVAAARASTNVAFQGLVETRGAIGGLDAPVLSTATAPLRGTSRLRAWWLGPNAWRVATLTATGEQDLYGTTTGLVQWDYERNRARMVLGTPRLRLPRADDLLPPQVVRRLLAGLDGAERLEPLSSRRIAGRPGAGIRVIPDGSDTTVSRLDIWVDRTGVPLALRAYAAGSRAPAFETTFLDLSFARPTSEQLGVRIPVDARSSVTDAPDLAAELDREAEWQLPQRLAGRPRTDPLADVRGIATYGTGLTRFVVAPVPPRFVLQAIYRAELARAPLVELTGGRALLFPGNLLVAGVAVSDDYTHAYVMAGTVRPKTLQKAIDELFADPPEPR